jgi:hypothetical protein
MGRLDLRASFDPQDRLRTGRRRTLERVILVLLDDAQATGERHPTRVQLPGVAQLSGRYARPSILPSWQGLGRMRLDSAPGKHARGGPWVDSRHWRGCGLAQFARGQRHCATRWIRRGRQQCRSRCDRSRAPGTLSSRCVRRGRSPLCCAPQLPRTPELQERSHRRPQGAQTLPRRHSQLCRLERRRSARHPQRAWRRWGCFLPLSPEAQSARPCRLGKNWTQLRLQLESCPQPYRQQRSRARCSLVVTLRRDPCPSRGATQR